MVYGYPFFTMCVYMVYYKIPGYEICTYAENRFMLFVYIYVALFTSSIALTKSRSEEEITHMGIMLCCVSYIHV